MDVLEKRYTDARSEWNQLENSDVPILFVGAATCGRAAGADRILAVLREEIAARKSDAKLVEVGCLGPCYLEPLVYVHKPGSARICYGNVTEEQARAIVDRHIYGDDPCSQWAVGIMGDGAGNGIPRFADHAVMRDQLRRIFHNCGIIDPQNFNHYLAQEGYRGFLHALEIGADKTLEAVRDSGLRGRGGAGFPTFKKWEFCRNSPGEKRFLICNCSEGDPGSFMNRTLIEGDPHAVLEGMLIAGYAMHATAGYIYCGVEYATVLERLRLAITQMREAGLLGENIAGSDFSFDIYVKRGAGAYVCGEETALIAAIESRRGMPRPRPPFPAASGLWGYPTTIQNVETLGNLPMILRHGAAWYKECGTENNVGTRSFSIAGSIKRPGLIEVPLGISLMDIIYKVGGGAPMGRSVKAVQTGGPSGGCIPAWRFDLPVEYEALAEAGSIMGSGGMIVLDEETCMVDLVKYFLTFTQNESCGKCPPCRVGTRAMLSIVTKIAEGRGEPEDLQTLESLARTVKHGSLCGLGQTAANPVLCTLQYFKDEFITHIVAKRCDAGVCTALTTTPCMSGCPADIYVPGFVSLAGQRRYDEARALIRERNPFASVCAYVCHQPCENRCQRGSIDEPVSIGELSRYLVTTEMQGAPPRVIANDANAKRKIAIIGGGPAGLTAAYFLARLGYKPVLYEASDSLGGMLTQTIPAFRLPREVVDQEIKMICDLGVTVEFNQRLGTNLSLSALREAGVEAVLVSSGSSIPNKLHVPGEEAEGVVDAGAYLSQYNQTGTAPAGTKVVVIGGNNAALDAARTAKELGAEEVTLLYRRTRREMTAYENCIDDAEREGVTITCLAGPMAVNTEAGRVCGLRCVRMELHEYDLSGRQAPVALEDSQFEINADLVIVAVGRQPNAEFSWADPDLEMDVSGFIRVHPESQQSSIPWLFACGEAAQGARSIIEAIASGERAAVGLDHFLTGASHPFWRVQSLVDTPFDQDADFVATARLVVDRSRVEKQKDSFEEGVGIFTEENTVSQALRCLRCDYCKEHQ